MAVARRSGASARALPAEGWLYAGALGAVICVAIATAGDPVLWLAVAVACVAAGIAFYEPRAVGPLLALALPLEITKLAFPFLETRSELGGGLEPTSIVDAGRLAVALAFAVWLIRPMRPRAEALPTSALTLPLALVFLVYAASTLWAPDAGAARTESLRLLFALGGFALVPFFVRDRESLRWTLLALVASAGVLAVLGIYQQITGDFFWNEGLGEFGERRINTLFADPNHFARFLLTGVVLALAVWCFTRREVQVWLLAPAIGLSLLTLVFTGSRGAWIVGAAMLPLAVWVMPLGRDVRVRIIGGGVALVLGIALATAAASPFFTKRVNTFTFGVEAFGARPYLVEAGLDMFGDHPIAGVGAGGYQTAFEQDYYGHKDATIKANVTASHTSAVTVLAELGLIGAAVVLFLILRWALYVRDLARTGDIELRTIALALGICSAIVFFGSQTEGRFLEDPYLWLFAGLAVAIEGILARRDTYREAQRMAPGAESSGHGGRAT